MHRFPLIEISFIGGGLQRSLQVAAQDGANISLHGEAKYFKQETAALLLPLLLLLSFYNKRHCARLGRLAMVIKGYIPIEKVPPGSSVSRGAAFPAGPSSCGGGVMRIGRAFIIPAILALGVAGSALVGSAIPAAASNVSVAHVQTTGLTIGTNMFHHGHKTGLSPGTNMFHHG